MSGIAVQELVLNLIAIELEGNRTTANYRRIIKRDAMRFFTWLKAQGMEDLRNVGKAEIVCYYQHLCSQCSTAGTRTIGKLLSRATVNGLMTAVKKVFAVLYNSGYTKKDPFHGLDLGMRGGGGVKRRPFTEGQMAEFLEQIEVDTPLGLRDRAMFELIYSSGLRVGEAARLTMGDINLERREIIVHGKGSRDRLVPISIVARDFLKLYIGERFSRLDEAVFLGTKGKGIGKPMRPKEITRRFHTLLVKFNMDGIGRCAHAVRHSTATHLLDNGASVRHIQELLGHRNIDTTVRYTQVQTTGLKKVYMKYHPGEHELFETVDEVYEKRLASLVASKSGGMI